MAEAEDGFSLSEDVSTAVFENYSTLVDCNEKLCARIREKGKTIGGYLCIADHRGVPLIVMGVGEIDEEKAPTQFELTCEKARRLAEHPEHVLSFQSRDPDAKQYGGAVRGKKYIASFSGLPERLDEYFCCTILMKLEDLTAAEAEALLEEHDNEFRHELYLENFG